MMDIDGARAEIKDCITRLENIQSDLQAIVSAEILADFGDEVVGEILDRLNECALDLATLEVPEEA
jgi:hypothetical protein